MADMPYNPFKAFLNSETQQRNEEKPGFKIAQAKQVKEYHVNDDVDSGRNAHHHTLGKGPTQAAAGNHDHTILGEEWHQVGTAGEPSFQNSWVNSTFPMEFIKNGINTVFIRGRVVGGTAQTVFTLPEGYRPTQAVRGLLFAQAGDIVSWNINTNGNVDTFVQSTDGGVVTHVLYVSLVLL